MASREDREFGGGGLTRVILSAGFEPRVLHDHQSKFTATFDERIEIWVRADEAAGLRALEANPDHPAILSPPVERSQARRHIIRVEVNHAEQAVSPALEHGKVVIALLGRRRASRTQRAKSDMQVRAEPFDADRIQLS